MTSVYCVLKVGGEYKEAHVAWLRKQFGKTVDVLCLTDSPMSADAFKAFTGATKVPLEYDAWGGRGWWAKMELFRPDIKGNMLFVDLDTVIIDVDKLGVACAEQSAHKADVPIVLADFYFPATSIGSGIMWLPEARRAAIWREWTADPAGHIKRNGGDQDFLTPLLWDADRWQDRFPGEVVSYKAHINGNHAPQFFRPGFNDFTKIAVVCFHGFPRPWQTLEEWIPK